MLTSLYRVILFSLVWISLSLCGANAFAHLMPTGHGTINVIGSKIYVIISIPAASFSLKKIRGKGLLNARELRENSEVIRQQLRRGLGIESQGGQVIFETILVNLPSGADPTQPGEKTSPEDHDQNTNTDLMIMIVAQAKNPPTSISIRSTLWANEKGSIKFKTTISEGAKTLRSELGTLSALHPKYVFFAGPKHVVLGSMRLGFEHIIGGLDHLLFILLMLIGCFVRKRWAILLSSFTAACTLSFAAISANWIAFPVFSFISVFWVESIILASLLIAAIPIILRARPPLSVEACIVFILGLFHGLGFASAMAGAQNYNHLVELKIAGFNSGVFMGELLIAGLLFVFYKFNNYIRSGNNCEQIE